VDDGPTGVLIAREKQSTANGTANEFDFEDADINHVSGLDAMKQGVARQIMFLQLLSARPAVKCEQ